MGQEHEESGESCQIQNNAFLAAAGAKVQKISIRVHCGIDLCCVQS